MSRRTDLSNPLGSSRTVKIIARAQPLRVDQAIEELVVALAALEDLMVFRQAMGSTIAISSESQDPHLLRNLPVYGALEGVAAAIQARREKAVTDA